jgi:hypothetical protein
VATNCIVIEESEKLGVRSYIFVPCIVCKFSIIELGRTSTTLTDHPSDGKGEGFGNKISIQTVAVVRAAKAAGKVYKVDDGKPVCAHG